MIALVPALFMVVSGVGVIILSSLRKGLGLPWLLSAGSAVLAWAGMLALHWLPSNPVYIIGWNPVESFTNLLGFQLDLISWPYSFALITLTLAVIFTSSARIETTAPYIWGLGLVIGGLGSLAVMAITPIAFILIWSLIDLGEFVVLQRTIRQPVHMQQIILSYGVQLASTFMIAAAMIMSRFNGSVLDISQLSFPSSIFLFLGAVLRLGMFPRRASYPVNYRFRRGFGSLLRGVQPATGLVLLARIPDLNLTGEWLTLLQIAVAITALYGSIRWMTVKDETEARPFWVIGLSGLAILSVLNGFQITSMIWGLILILIGGVMGLYSSRDARIQYIPVLAILGFLGLPFTPAAGGWVGLADAPFSIFTIFYFLIHIILVLGLVRHLFQPGESYIQLERWVRVVYPGGLLMLIITQWIVATLGWPGSYTAGVWWASFIPIIVIGAGYFVWVQTAFREKNMEKILRVNYLSRKYFLKPAADILRGDWLIDILGVIYNLVDQFVRILSRLLEGEGGFIWVLFFLTLLVTMMTSLGGGG